MASQLELLAGMATPPPESRTPKGGPPRVVIRSPLSNGARRGGLHQLLNDSVLDGVSPNSKSGSSPAVFVGGNGSADRATAGERRGYWSASHNSEQDELRGTALDYFATGIGGGAKARTERSASPPDYFSATQREAHSVSPAAAVPATGEPFTRTNYRMETAADDGSTAATTSVSPAAHRLHDDSDFGRSPSLQQQQQQHHSAASTRFSASASGSRQRGASASPAAAAIVAEEEDHDAFLAQMLHELQQLNERNRLLSEHRAAAELRAERADTARRQQELELERVRVHHRLLSETSLELQDELHQTRELLDRTRAEHDRAVAAHVAEKVELSSRLAREEAFGASARSELHMQSAAAGEAAQRERELLREVELCNGRAEQMLSDAEAMREHYEEKVAELRSFISELQMRLEHAEGGQHQQHQQRAAPRESSAPSNGAAAASAKQDEKLRAQKARIAELEAAVASQQEEHRKRMKRQVKLEAELEQARAALQAASAEVEKLQHKNATLLPQIEAVALLAAECRDGATTAVKPERHPRRSSSRRSGVESVESSIVAVVAAPEHRRLPSDVVLPSDVLLAAAGSSATESAEPPRTDPNAFTAAPRRRSNRRRTTASAGDSSSDADSASGSDCDGLVGTVPGVDASSSTCPQSEAAPAASPAPALPPVYPSSAPRHSQPPAAATATTAASRSRSRSRSPPAGSKKMPVASGSSGGTDLERTPAHLLRGANPLFQAQFVAAVLKRSAGEAARLRTDCERRVAEALASARHDDKDVCRRPKGECAAAQAEAARLRALVQHLQAQTHEQSASVQQHHEHSVQQRRTAESIADELRRATEQLCGQASRLRELDAALQQASARAEREAFAHAEAQCALREQRDKADKLQAQLARAQAERHGSDASLRHEREQQQSLRAELDAAKRAAADAAEKHEKHKELLNSSLKREEKRYSRALQHADKLEAKLVATQCEVGAMVQKLRAAELDAADKQRRITELQRANKETATRLAQHQQQLDQDERRERTVQQHDAESASIAAARALSAALVEYDGAVRGFVELVYSRTEFRSVEWDLMPALAGASGDATAPETFSELARVGMLRAAGSAGLLRCFGAFALEQLAANEQLLQCVETERGRVEFLNSELAVYLRAAQQQQEADEVERLRSAVKTTAAGVASVNTSVASTSDFEQRVLADLAALGTAAGSTATRGGLPSAPVIALSPRPRPSRGERFAELDDDDDENDHDERQLAVDISTPAPAASSAQKSSSPSSSKRRHHGHSGRSSRRRRADAAALESPPAALFVFQ